MTQLSALQVADLWTAAGGPRSRVVEWVAIALGESSYDTTVVSPAGAIGLWQIMPFNAAPNGVSVAQLYEGYYNALVAVRMSGHGTNCAAWDSCYRDIYASGRYAFLAFPEVGSADYNNLGVVAAELGHDKIGGAAPPPPMPDLGNVGPALAHIQDVTNRVLPQLARVLVAERMASNALWT